VGPCDVRYSSDSALSKFLRSIKRRRLSAFFVPIFVKSAILGSPSLIWVGMLRESEAVGGRAYEPQCICFVWSCGVAAYRNGGANVFSRDGYQRWRFEVLQHK
jgi:hypothetical protein